MPQFAQSIISLLSIGTLAGQFFAIFLLVFLLISYFKKKNKQAKKVSNMIQEYYTILVFLLSSAAVVGSLTLSEVINLPPCELCWYQRILMYPVALISLVALIANENIRKYVLAFSIIGGLIAIYHILLQFFPTVFECSDEVAKCSAVQFSEFGYITIPVMSLTIFVLLILVSLFGKIKK